MIKKIGLFLTLLLAICASFTDLCAAAADTTEDIPQYPYLLRPGLSPNAPPRLQSIPLRAGSSFRVGGLSPFYMTHSSDDLSAMLNENNQLLSVFKTQPDGTTTEIVGSPVRTKNADSVALNQNGTLLAITDQTNDTITMFQIISDPKGSIDAIMEKIPSLPLELAQLITDYSLPELVPIGTFPTNAASMGIAFSPNGRLLAQANSEGTVTIFHVASNGTLTEIEGSPFPVGSREEEVWSVAFNPHGNLLATANPSTKNVSIFEVEPDGRLTWIKSYPTGVGEEGMPMDVAFSSDGTLLATANGETVSLFKVASDGTLTLIGPFNLPYPSDSVAFIREKPFLTVSDSVTGEFKLYDLRGKVTRSVTRSSLYYDN